MLTGISSLLAQWIPRLFFTDVDYPKATIIKDAKSIKKGSGKVTAHLSEKNHLEKLIVQHADSYSIAYSLYEWFR